MCLCDPRRQKKNIVLFHRNVKERHGQKHGNKHHHPTPRGENRIHIPDPSFEAEPRHSHRTPRENRYHDIHPNPLGEAQHHYHTPRERQITDQSHHCTPRENRRHVTDPSQENHCTPREYRQHASEITPRPLPIPRQLRMKAENLSHTPRYSEFNPDHNEGMIVMQQQQRPNRTRTGLLEPLPVRENMKDEECNGPNGNRGRKKKRRKRAGGQDTGEKEPGVLYSVETMDNMDNEMRESYA